MLHGRGAISQELKALEWQAAQIIRDTNNSLHTLCEDVEKPLIEKAYNEKDGELIDQAEHIKEVRANVWQMKGVLSPAISFGQKQQRRVDRVRKKFRKYKKMVKEGRSQEELDSMSDDD